MKDLKLIIAVILIIALAMVSFVACSLSGEGTDTPAPGISQDDPSGSQQGGETEDPTGEDPSDPSSGGEEGEEIEPTSVTFREKGFTFSHPDYEYFRYWVNGKLGSNEIYTGALVSYANTVGDYTVRVCALNEEDEAVAEAQFTYSTKEVDLSELQVVGKTVSWEAKGASVFVKTADTDYEETTNTSFTAVSDDAVVSVKVLSGINLQERVYYIGKRIEKSARVIPDVKTVLPTPQCSVKDDTLVWVVSANAVRYEVSYDGGDFSEATFASFSEIIGDHTLSVKAIGDKIFYTDSEPAVISYTTRKSDLSVVKIDADKAHIETNGAVTFSLSGEDEYYPYPAPVEVEKSGGKTELVYPHPASFDYVAGETGLVTFRARASVEESEGLIVAYVDSDLVTMNFVAPAQRALPVEDGTGATLWTAEKGSEILSSAVKSDLRYDGSSAIRFDLSADGAARRVTKGITLVDGYNALSFFYKGDGENAVLLTLSDKESGFSLSYDLGVMPAYWMQVTLSFEQEGWLVNGEYPLAELWAARAESEDVPAVVGNAFAKYELLLAADSISFTLSGASESDAVYSHFLDEVLFAYEASPVGGRYQPLYAVAEEYIAFEPLPGDVYNELMLSLKEGNVFTLRSTALARNFLIEGIYQINEKQGTISLVEQEKDFSLTLAFAYNGFEMLAPVVEGEGAAAHCSGCLFRALADLTFDFDVVGEDSSDGGYWTQYTASASDPSGWMSLDSSKIEHAERNGSDVLRLSAGRDLTNRFVCNEKGENIGLANTFRVELGNLDTGAEAFGLKIFLVDEMGVRRYLKGSDSSFDTFDPTIDLLPMSWTWEDAIVIRSFEIVIENRGSSNASLYLENLELLYESASSVFSEYASPVISVGEGFLSFTHELPVTSFEYSLNGGAWQEGTFMSIPTTAKSYHLRVRARIGEEVSQEANYSFRVEEVALSAISVAIEENVRTAYWTTNGKISVRKDMIDGNSVTEGEYEPFEGDSLVVDGNIRLYVRAEGWYSAGAQDVFYVGAKEVKRNVLVNSIVLDKVVITASEEGFAWEPVANANGYEVSVNGREYVFYEDNTFPFATEEGEYTIRVRSVIKEGDEIIATSSDSVEEGDKNVFTYHVKEVSLSELSTEGLTVSWIAVAYEVRCFEKQGNNYDEVSFTAFENEANEKTGEYVISPTLQGNYPVRVEAMGGYDPVTKVYYHSDLEKISREVRISVSSVRTPVVTYDESLTALAWEKDTIASGYRYRLDRELSEGEWSPGDWQEAGDSYAFPEEEGSYRFVLQGMGNGSNRLDSWESEPYAFRVLALRLSEIEIVEQDESHCKGEYSYTARVVYYRDGGSNAIFTATTASSYETLGVTKDLEIYVQSEYDAENRIYYYSVDAEKERRTKRMIVPIYLETPTALTVEVNAESKATFTWNAVANAGGYRYLLEKKNEQGAYVSVQAPNDLNVLRQVATLSDGAYRVTVEALRKDDPLQYPSRGPAVLSFTVETVSISSPVPDPENANRLTWNYVAEHLYKSFEGYSEAEDDLWDRDYYLNADGNEGTLYLKAVGNVPSSSALDGASFYVGSAQAEFSLDYSQLLTPILSLHENGSEVVDGIEWEPVSKAAAYRVKEVTGDLTDEEIAAAAASDAGWDKTTDTNRLFVTTQPGLKHLIFVKAVGAENSLIQPSEAAIWSYTPYAISISTTEEIESAIDVSTSGSTASWTKVGVIDFRIKEASQSFPGEYFPPQSDDTSYTTDRTLTLYVRCSAGYDKTNDRYYFGGDSIERIVEIIVPIVLQKPTLTLEGEGVRLSSVTGADYFDYTIGKVGGASRNGSVLREGFSYLLGYASELSSEEAGAYILTVVAKSKNATQYYDSAEASITFSVRTVALTAADVLIDPDTGKITFGEGAVGVFSVKKKDANTYTQVVGRSHQPAASGTYTVKAESGIDEGNVVYLGSVAPFDVAVIVPIFLEIPTSQYARESILLSSVEHAIGWEIKEDGGDWTRIPYAEEYYNEEQGAYLLSRSYKSGIGEHTFEYRAYSEDPQYPSPEQGEVISYVTQGLTLSFSLQGATYSWSASAYSLEKKVGSGAYSSGALTDTHKATESMTLTVRARRGYKAGIYYYYKTEYNTSSALSVTITKLAKPTGLAANGNKITWNAVDGATEGYEVKINSGAYSTVTSRESSFQTKEGTYRLSVRAKGNGSTLVESDAATFDYTVKTVTLSDLTVNVATVSWTAQAYKTYCKVGNGSYAETDGNSYVVTASGTSTVYVKAEGGYKNGIYYYASSPIVKTATVVLQKLPAPVLTTNSKGVTWAAVSGAAAYEVTIDGSTNTQTDRSAAFSASIGKHTVKVRAVGTGSYSNSDLAEYTYETKATTLEFVNESSAVDHVSWRSNAVKVQYSTDNGSTFKDTEYSGYTARQSGTVKFRAVSGWDAVAKVYYSGSASVLSKSFTLPGFCIGSNFENGTSGWSLEWYNNNKWETNSAISVTSVTDAYGSGSALRLHSYLNGMAYRFGYSFGDMPGNYKSMSFNVKLNDYLSSGTTLRFQDSASGTYVDYALSNLNLTCGVWYHVTIGFEDENLIINMGNKEYTAAYAAKNFSSQFYAKIKTLDKMYITVKGNYGGGVDAYTYIDNFQLSTSSHSGVSKTRITALDLTFGDGTVNQNYTNGWSAESYGSSGYTANAGALKIESGAKVLSLYCAYSTYRATYTVSSGVGTVNHLSMSIGAGQGNTVNYRIEIVKKNGSVIYAAGGDGYFAQIASGSGSDSLSTLSFNFTDTEIKSIIIYATATGGDGHLYVDDLVLSKLS